MARNKAKAKTSKAAIFAVIMSLICVVAVVFMALTKCFTDFRVFKRTQSGVTANADTLYAPDAGLLINQSTSDGIMLYSEVTPLADFETYSLDPNVEAVKTITARITPADTTLQKVDYSAEWKNATSAWATGKSATDYITLAQSSDGSLDCAVSLKDAIGEQIIITCTARPLEEGDWVPSATCTVDYYKRVTSASLRFWGWSTDRSDVQYSVEVGNGSTLTFNDFYYEDSDDNNSYGNEMDVIQTMGVGTIEDYPTNLSVTISISDSIAQSVKNAAGVSQLKSFSPIHTNGGTDGLYLRTELTNMFGGTSNLNSHRSEIYSAFKSAYDSGTPALKVEISYTASPSGFSYNFTYNVHLNPLLLGVKSQGVELPPSIIF